MLPSLTQPSLLGVLLLLSVSNLLQWENVTCAPIHENKTEQGDVSLKDLFDHAITLSQTTSALTTEMRKLFFSDGFSANMFKKFVLDFFKDKMYMIKILNSCHTFSLNTPETVEEARDISFEDFLKMILSIVHSWNNPLHHLVTELGGMKGAPDAILSRAKGVETINSELLENIMTILSKIHPGLKENETYPVWTDLASLQAADEECHFFALYKLFYCLRVDTYTIDLYLKYLRCLLVKGDICSSLEF
ncbi:prolactin-7C1-like isoform X1 [Cricetulus griseus]|uniref:Prolactin-7C1-like isoform X1 n=1 Tax=Cricetulus griseus TaxID=10029 RepID=A0A9J7FPU2_CRIGR|nr:prolactin-7C1-like isoform X1 [Cricetulus griseus]XP_027265365.1 prolactin-7C1-like isoform X1 [Cricetulus griseus]